MLKFSKLWTQRNLNGQKWSLYAKDTAGQSLVNLGTWVNERMKKKNHLKSGQQWISNQRAHQELSDGVLFIKKGIRM